MLSAAKLSERFGTADDVFDVVFGFGFLNEFDLGGNSELFGSEEEIVADPVIDNDPD